jgi:hypothetical protein
MSKGSSLRRNFIEKFLLDGNRLPRKLADVWCAGHYSVHGEEGGHFAFIPVGIRGRMKLEFLAHFNWRVVETEKGCAYYCRRCCDRDVVPEHCTDRFRGADWLSSVNTKHRSTAQQRRAWAENAKRKKASAKPKKRKAKVQLSVCCVTCGVVDATTVNLGTRGKLVAIRREWERQFPGNVHVCQDCWLSIGDEEREAEELRNDHACEERAYFLRSFGLVAGEPYLGIDDTFLEQLATDDNCLVQGSTDWHCGPSLEELYERDKTTSKEI